MSNIDQFNLYVGRILSKLYQNVPVPIALDCLELATGKSIVETYDPPLDRGKLLETSKNEDAKFVSHTIRWLIKSGYILNARHTDHEMIFVDCVLSVRALEALNAIPDSMRENKTIGQQLSEVAIGATKTAGNTAISETVGRFFGAVMRGFSDTSG